MHLLLLANAAFGLAPAAAPPLTIPPAVAGTPLEAVVKNAVAALEVDRDNNGRERDGSWCEESAKNALVQSALGLRGKKTGWWLDAPRPLRAVVAAGDRYEVSVLCLPGGTSLPGAAYPAGSVIVCQPLLGQLTCRRVRIEEHAGGGEDRVQELMKRTLSRGDAKPYTLFGGCCHEWKGTPGVASALLHTVILPPTSAFPAGSHGAIGWKRPPAEGMQGDLVEGAAIGAPLSDLLTVESAATGAAAAARDADEPPRSAQELLQRLGGRVGGLTPQLATIVRRALASRLLPTALTQELGISAVRGVLLYGPPGCGKTLLAREIAAALGAREPKIVNGPEMMSKYVGDSEAFIRELFAEAELEQAERGAESELHVIVLDELDAFCRARGTLRGDTSGIRDSVVNQLLAKLDGVAQLDNVLVVGMTNRQELIDDALLRSGRLEVHVRVGLPDGEGRQEILNIHAAHLLERGCLDDLSAAAIGSGALAAATPAYSGADLAGLLRSASSFALERYVDAAMLRGWEVGGGKRSGKGAFTRARLTGFGGGDGDGEASAPLLEVRWDDVERAMREVAPTSRAGRGVRGWWSRRRLRGRAEKALRAEGVVERYLRE